MQRSRCFYPLVRTLALAVVCLSAVATAQTAAPPSADARAVQAIVLPDGGRYEVPLVDGLLEGKGRVVWNDKHYYEGEFHRGRMQGQGKLVQHSGTYEGQFENGLPNGAGEYTDNNGTRYEGQFKDGVLNGPGQYTHITHKSVI